MDADVVLTLPLYAVAVFGILGLISNWRRTLAILVFAYAALIFAAQHNGTLATTDLIGSLSNSEDYQARSALAFIISTGTLFVLLNGLFELFWGRSGGERSPSGISRLSQGILAGLVGWVLGVILVVGMLAYQGEQLPRSRSNSETRLYSGAMNSTTDMVVNVIDPWLPDDTPAFLGDY